MPEWPDSPGSETQRPFGLPAASCKRKELVAGGFQRDTTAAAQTSALLTGKRTLSRGLVQESTMGPPPNVEHMLGK